MLFSFKETPLSSYKTVNVKSLPVKSQSVLIHGLRRERDKQREIRERGREIDERIEFGFQHEVSHLSAPRVTPA